MKYIVIFNEDKLKWFESREEAEEFVYELSEKNLEEYCQEYDIELDEDVSPQRIDELIWGSAAESGEVRIISLKKLLNLIKKSDLSEDEKRELEKELKEYEYESVGDYEGLNDLIF